MMKLSLRTQPMLVQLPSCGMHIATSWVLSVGRLRPCPTRHLAPFQKTFGPSLRYSKSGQHAQGPIMNKLLSFLPSATNMVRIDHTHVLSTFHQYKVSAPLYVRRALVGIICTALEVHAQLEEEIFYPAVQRAAGAELIQHSVEEHQE